MVVGAVVVTDACLQLDPNAALQLTVDHRILNRNSGRTASQCTVCTLISVGIEIIPVIFNLLPAGLQIASDSVIAETVILNQTGNICGCTTIRAGQHAGIVIVFVAMSGRGNGGAPRDHRLTDIAVGSAGVAIFRAGCGFVSQFSDSMGMDQCAIGRTIGRCGHGSFHGHASAETFAVAAAGIGNNKAFQNLAVNGHSGDAQCRGILASHMILAVPGPDTDRDAGDGLLTGVAAAVFLDQMNVQNVFQIVDAVCGNFVLQVAAVDHIALLYGKAGKHGRIICFPGICRVKLDSGVDLLHLAQIRGLDIHIVDGACFGGIASVIVSAHRNQCGFVFYRNGQRLGQLAGIAHLVGDFESDGVGAHRQGYCLGGGKGIAGSGNIHKGYSIHIDHGGAVIQAAHVAGGIVCHLCAEVHGSGGGNSREIHALVIGDVGGIGDHRSVPVIHCGAVVQGNVVNVERMDRGGRGLDVGTDKRGGTGVCGIRRITGLDIVISGQIDGRINPSGFGNIRFRTAVQVLSCTTYGLKSKVRLLAAQRAVVILDVKLRLESQPCGTLRDIEPHTQGSSIFSVGYVTQNNSLIGVKQDIVGPAAKVCLCIVQSPSQCISTIFHLAILSSYNGSIAVHFGGILAVKGVGPNQRIIHSVGNTPSLGFVKTHETCQIAIFKVEDDFRTLAIFNSQGNSSCFGMLILRGNNNTSNGFVRGCGVGQCIQIQNTRSLIADSPSEGIRLEIHGEFTCFVCPDIHLNDKALSVGQHSAVNSKLGNSGILDVNCFLSSGVLHGIQDSDLAQLSVGNEHAFLVDAAEGVIRQRPDAAGWHIHLRTGSINGNRAKGIGAIRNKVIIVGSNVSMVKSTGFHAFLLCNEYRVQGRTFRTIAGGGTHGQFSFTFASGNESGGTATVTVYCVYTAQCQHKLAHFVSAQANRVIGTTAIDHTHDQASVRQNTQHGAGSRRGGTLDGGGYQLTVLDQPAEVRANGMPFIAMECLISGTQLTAAILVDGQICSAGTGVGVQFGIVVILQHFALVNQEGIGCVAVVSQRNVHAAHQIVAQGILIIGCRIRDLGIGPVGAVCQILVDAVVTGQNIHLAAIDLEYVDHLTAGGITIVQNDFCLFSSSDQTIVFLGNDGIVAIGDTGIKPIIGCCKCHRRCGLFVDGYSEFFKKCQFLLILNGNFSLFFFAQFFNRSHYCTVGI